MAPWSGERPVVHQDDFSPGGGNALQAAVCTVLQLPLPAVPNFLKSPEGYLSALDHFLRPSGLALLKLPLGAGLRLPYPVAEGSVCILAAGSPRGEHKHCVVAVTEGQELRTVHDPYPDGAGVVEADGAWAGFFVARDPVQLWRLQDAAVTSSGGGAT